VSCHKRVCGLSDEQCCVPTRFAESSRHSREVRKFHGLVTCDTGARVLYHPPGRHAGPATSDLSLVTLQSLKRTEHREVLARHLRSPATRTPDTFQTSLPVSLISKENRRTTPQSSCSLFYATTRPAPARSSTTRAGKRSAPKWSSAPGTLAPARDTRGNDLTRAPSTTTLSTLSVTHGTSRGSAHATSGAQTAPVARAAYRTSVSSIDPPRAVLKASCRLGLLGTLEHLGTVEA